MTRFKHRTFGVIASASALMASLLAAGAVQAALVTIPQSALSSSPGVYTAGGYYTTTLGPNIVTTGGGNAANVGQADGRNDDGFMALALGFNVTFFGTTYNSLFINNNGNVSFGAGISDFIPVGPTGANQPVISPFFSDVDTRNASSGVVHYNLTADQLIVTWDNVGRFSSLYPPGDSYQLVLRSDAYSIPFGEGQIGFFYQTMGWEVSQTSTTAAVGFGNGAGDAIVIAGSNLAGMNQVMNDRYIWFNQNLTPVCGVPGAPACAAPEPGSLSLLALAAVGLGLVRRRRA